MRHRHIESRQNLSLTIMFSHDLIDGALPAPFMRSLMAECTSRIKNFEF